ncbi:hypothetical protein [Ensifer soli]|uniref:hypothetical protein n=1 Tax=Ciceribacter sp. sgz301302 TaxID=3342379 RepID=UPI0035B99E69
MGRIKGRDTVPEIAVRRLLHRPCYRYRLHARGLPGRPDTGPAQRRSTPPSFASGWRPSESEPG